MGRVDGDEILVVDRSLAVGTVFIFVDAGPTEVIDELPVEMAAGGDDGLLG